MGIIASQIANLFRATMSSKPKPLITPKPSTADASTQTPAWNTEDPFHPSPPSAKDKFLPGTPTHTALTESNPDTLSPWKPEASGTADPDPSGEATSAPSNEASSKPWKKAHRGQRGSKKHKKKAKWEGEYAGEDEHETAEGGALRMERRWRGIALDGSMNLREWLLGEDEKWVEVV